MPFSNILFPSITKKTKTKKNKTDHQCVHDSFREAGQQKRKYKMTDCYRVIGFRVRYRVLDISRAGINSSKIFLIQLQGKFVIIANSFFYERTKQQKPLRTRVSSSVMNASHALSTIFNEITFF